VTSSTSAKRSLGSRELVGTPLNRVKRCRAGFFETVLTDAGAAFAGDGAATSIPEAEASGDTVPVGDDRLRQTHDGGSNG